MRRADEAEYREFAVARMRRLRRTAYLLCRDWHTADDLVAIALDKLYRHWPRRSEIADIDAYTRTILARAWVDEQRRPWRREWVTDDGAPLDDTDRTHRERSGATMIDTDETNGILDSIFDDEPPSSLDIDSMIARSRSRLRRRRWVAATTTAAAAVSLLLAVATTLNATIPAPGGLPAVPPSSTSDPLEEIRLSFDKAAWTATQQAAGAATVTGVTWSSYVMLYPPGTAGEVDGHITYIGQGMIIVNGRSGKIDLSVQSAAKTEPTSEAPGLTSGSCEGFAGRSEFSCTVTTGPDGEQVVAVAIAYPTPAGELPQFENRVDVYRRDGARVSVSVRNGSGLSENDPPTGAPPPLTIDQVVQIALNPALTLRSTHLATR